MIYEEFLSAVSTSLKSRLGSEYTVYIQKVPKNNGTILDGLCITKTGERVTPTIYLNPFFEHLRFGIPLPDILDEIVQVYTEGSEFPQINPEILSDVKNLKDKIAYKLIHTNSNIELLKDLPCITFLDLSIIFYLFLEENKYGHMTATIHNNHMENWGLDVDELWRLAEQNAPRLLPAELRSMDEVAEDFIHEQPDDEYTKELFRTQKNRKTPSMLYVLSNTCGINGSCTMLYPDILKNFADQLGQDLIILPSSIHEVLLVPYSEDICFKDLFHMVFFINQTEVAIEDRLSNEVYRYHRESGQITLVPRLSEKQAS